MAPARRRPSHYPTLDLREAPPPPPLPPTPPQREQQQPPPRPPRSPQRRQFRTRARQETPPPAQTLFWRWRVLRPQCPQCPMQGRRRGLSYTAQGKEPAKEQQYRQLKYHPSLGPRRHSNLYLNLSRQQISHLSHRRRKEEIWALRPGRGRRRTRTRMDSKRGRSRTRKRRLLRRASFLLPLFPASCPAISKRLPCPRNLAVSPRRAQVQVPYI